MKEISIKNIPLKLSIDRSHFEGSNIRVKSPTQEVLLLNLEIETASELIQRNFDFVLSHYKATIEKARENFDDNDLHELSLIIVLHYLYMYCMWRTQYEAYRQKDLKFDPADLHHSSTHDALFFYFKEKHPKTWREKSALLLNMSAAEFQVYYKSREDYYNK
jgi:hypothetical protein